MNVGIFTGGKHAPKKITKSFIKKNSFDYIIAADSGLEIINDLDLTPNYIIGDFDSLKNKALLKKYKHIETKHFPEDKDFTDTELAMQKALKVLHNANKKQITIFGAGGAERLDHLIYFLRVFTETIPPTIWFFNSGVGFCISSELEKKLELSLPLKTTVSVFNIPAIKTHSHFQAKITSEGLHWELDELDWSTHASISNRNDKTQISLTTINGRFLVLIHGHEFIQ